MAVVAIDPGRNGALAIFGFDTHNRPLLVDIYDMPANAKHVDSQTIRDLYITAARSDMLTTTVVIEKVWGRPGQGGSASFNFGQGYGTLIGVAAGLAYPCVTVNPGRWQRHLGLYGEPKTATLDWARETYPEFVDMFRYKKHEGRADAVAIGHAYLAGVEAEDAP